MEVCGYHVSNDDALVAIPFETEVVAEGWWREGF
jgi:hypothetical protein